MSHAESSSRSALHVALLAAAVAALCLTVRSDPARAATSTSVTSAANIPYSGILPGGVDMATGELILVCSGRTVFSDDDNPAICPGRFSVMRPDIYIDGPMPLVFGRYYGSMIAREGLASGHLGRNWLGSFDWSLSVMGPTVNVVTNRGQLIQFQQNPVGGFDLVRPTDQKYRLEAAGPTWFSRGGPRRC